MSCGELRGHQSFATADSEASRHLQRCNPDNTESRECDDHMPGKARVRTDCIEPWRDFLCDTSKSLKQIANQMRAFFSVPLDREIPSALAENSGARCFDSSPDSDSCLPGPEVQRFPDYPLNHRRCPRAS